MSPNHAPSVRNGTPKEFNSLPINLTDPLLLVTGTIQSGFHRPPLQMVQANGLMT
jgi:hypothetical protein